MEKATRLLELIELFQV